MVCTVYKRESMRPAGGGGGGAHPLEIEKQKKVIRANFKLFHLYFDTFLVGNIILSAIISA